MKMKSLMEEYNVPAFENGVITGELRFSNLITKNQRLKYPEYDVLIVNPSFNFIDKKFEEAMKSKVFKLKNGKDCIRLVFKDYNNRKYLPIKGHAENGEMITSDKLLILNDHQFYLSTGQKVSACVKSYLYSNKYGNGVTHSLSYLEIASIKNPQIS